MQSLASIGANASPAVLGAIRQASTESGVDFTYLLQKAATESSFNPTAKATTSSASGLYQFIDQTWLTEISAHGAQYGLQKEASAVTIDSDGHASVADPALRREIMGLKDDPKVAAEMAASFTKDNKAALQASVGGTIGSTELYLAHFLGSGGAAKFIGAMRSNPNQSAAAVLPAAADANEPVFYHADGSARSLSEVYNRFAAKFGSAAVPVGASAASTTTAANAYGAYAAPGTGVSSASLPTATMADSGSVNSGGGPAVTTVYASQGRASLYEMLMLSQLSTIDPANGKPANSQSL